MKKSKLMLAVLGAAFASTTAMAGRVQPAIVDVDLVGMVASGDMATARYSKNETELIGCGIRVAEDGAGGIFTFGFCQAEDRDAEEIICMTQNADLLKAIESSGEYGFITFSWDRNTDCTRIGFSNQSFYLPIGLESNE